MLPSASLLQNSTGKDTFWPCTRPTSKPSQKSTIRLRASWSTELMPLRRWEWFKESCILLLLCFLLLLLSLLLLLKKFNINSIRVIGQQNLCVGEIHLKEDEFWIWLLLLLLLLMLYLLLLLFCCCNCCFCYYFDSAVSVVVVVGIEEAL